MVVKRLGKIALGCFGIFIILVILGLVFSGVIVKKIISGVIQQKTGIVQTNTGSSPGLSYTDPKTGTTLNLGNNKIPDDFPKDFPIYPGSTVTTSLSGNQSGQGNGFWLTLNSKDSIEKVVSYYQNSLNTNAWIFQTTTGSGTGTNWAISKGNLGGYLTIETLNDATSILIVLGENNPIATPTP